MKRLLLTLSLFGLLTLSSYAATGKDPIQNLAQTFSVTYLGIGSQVMVHTGTLVQCVEGNYSDVPFEKLSTLHLGAPIAGDVIQVETAGIVLRDAGHFFYVALKTPVGGYWTVEINKQ